MIFKCFRATVQQDNLLPLHRQENYMIKKRYLWFLGDVFKSILPSLPFKCGSILIKYCMYSLDLLIVSRGCPL